MSSERDSNSNRNGKGKGKEVREDISSSEQNARSGQDGSMLSRIANSSAGLASSMLSGTPNSNVLVSSISGQKGSSSSRPGASDSNLGERSLPFQKDTPGAPSFKAAEAHLHSTVEEAAFADFLDSADELTAPTPGPNDLETACQYHLPPETAPGNPGYGFPSVAEQQKHDGEDVVALLMQDEGAFELPEEEVIPPQEMESLRRALFGHSNAVKQLSALTDPMNFIPDHLQGPEVEKYVQMYMVKKDQERKSGQKLPYGSTIMRQEMEVSDAQDEEARQTFAWLEQWDDVLTSYMDEVWGDFEGLLKQARVEYEEVQKAEEDQEPPPETPALRRLRAILGHLRGAQG
ncbi:hypothetical protein DL546_003328 [Coniochaeta pulveracea]|nr:hypothetical protein DL546_003328 [Coniochaeta pulveracea]